VPTYEHDLLGSQVSLNGSDYRRTRAVRRGWIKGIGDGTAQSSLTSAATALATELGDYHPQISHLPLQDIRIQRAGADRAQYEAIYRHLDRGFNDNFRVVINYDREEPVRSTWTNEADSGVRWTPNAKPPFIYASCPVHTLSRTITQTSLSGVANALGADTNIINNGLYSIGGIDYPAFTLRYMGAGVQYQSNAIADGVYITYRFEVMGRASVYDNASSSWISVLPGWTYGDYEPTTTRPYWAPVFIPRGNYVNFTAVFGASL